MSSDPILDFPGAAPGAGKGPLARAGTLCQLCRYGEAQQLLSAVIADQPRNAEAWSLMARAQLGQGEPMGSLHAARAARSISPADEWAARLESAALLALERPLEAVEAAENAVRLGPRDWRSQVLLAEVLIAAGPRVQDADAAARRAVELAPGESRVQIAAGKVAEADGRPRDAGKAFVRALALDPQNVTAHASLERVRNGHTRRRKLPRLALSLRRA